MLQSCAVEPTRAVQLHRGGKTQRAEAQHGKDLNISAGRSADQQPQQPCQQKIPGRLRRKVQCGLKAADDPVPQQRCNVGKGPSGGIGDVCGAVLQNVLHLPRQLVRKGGGRNRQQENYCK